MSTGSDTSTKKPNAWKRVLRNVAIVLVSLLVAEGGLQLYSRHSYGFWKDPYVYIPYIEHVLPEKHPGTPDGFRPTFAQDRAGPRIWFLGGSTMFGGYNQGVEGDCEPTSPCTIPSLVNSILAERGLPGAAWNLAQPAFNSSQERILFQEMLFRNERPRIAIFYDGVNELGRTTIVGYPDEYHNFYDAVSKRLAWVNLERDFGKSTLKIPYLLDFLANSEDFPASKGAGDVLTYNPFRLSRNMHSGRRTAHDSGARERSAEYAASFGKDVAERYLYNLKVTQSICDAQGISCLFLWQPTVYTKLHRSEREQSSFDSPYAEWYLDSQRVALEIIEEDPWVRERGTFHDFTGALDDVKDDIFIDWCHIDEATPGHRLMAEAILDLLASEGLL